MKDFSTHFNERVFLVTGSTSGIGKELGKQILAMGGKVCFNSRFEENASRINELMADYPDKAIFVAADVNDYNQCLRLTKTIGEKFGRLDGVIANAGLSASGSIGESQPEVIGAVIQSNLLGSLYTVKAALPLLNESQGSIMLISSISAFSGLPDFGPYSISKMGLTALAQTLRIELHPHNIYVGIAYVGFTKNEATKTTFNKDGNLIAVPVHGNFKTAALEETAQKILKQLARKRIRQIHSFLGKISHMVNRFMPGISYRIMRRHYLKREK